MPIPIEMLIAMPIPVRRKPAERVDEFVNHVATREPRHEDHRPTVDDGAEPCARVNVRYAGGDAVDKKGGADEMQDVRVGAEKGQNVEAAPHDEERGDGGCNFGKARLTIRIDARTASRSTI